MCCVRGLSFRGTGTLFRELALLLGRCRGLRFSGLESLTASIAEDTTRSLAAVTATRAARTAAPAAVVPPRAVVAVPPAGISRPRQHPGPTARHPAADPASMLSHSTAQHSTCIHHGGAKPQRSKEYHHKGEKKKH